jgi:hypothetical protein
MSLQEARHAAPMTSTPKAASTADILLARWRPSRQLTSQRARTAQKASGTGARALGQNIMGTAPVVLFNHNAREVTPRLTLRFPGRPSPNRP